MAFKKILYFFEKIIMTEISDFVETIKVLYFETIWVYCVINLSVLTAIIRLNRQIEVSLINVLHGIS